MEGLDASYALLSDVNARNRDLQARLRSSLPLLWVNNALVMKSAAAPRRRRHTEQSADTEADQMLLALEGHVSLQVSRRYKRRVEWEVARRIARVDRELQQYPPAQRFWNRRKESTPPQASSYRQRTNEVERVGTTIVKKKQAVVTRSGKTDTQQVKRIWVKPKLRMETGGEERVVKHVATSPLRSGEIEDKENMRPNSVTKAPVGERIEASGMKESPSKEMVVKKNVTSELLDSQTMFEHSDDPADVHETIGDKVSSEPEKEETNSPRPVPSSLADTIAAVHQDSIHDNAFEIEESSPRTKTPPEKRPSSSIGRQVLSEFRTMPSVASFGAQPLLSAGGLGKAGDMRLNAEVLRRLFSDLDTDKDGHVNRVETCMALHRLQISVPTTKIISFFRHIHSSTDEKSVRSRRTQHLPMNEVINYKEFVAFVTAAYDQQQHRKAQRMKAPKRSHVWKENHDTAPPLSVPSTTLPIYAHPAKSPTATRHVHVHAPMSLQEEHVRAFEIDDTFEEKVIQEIPDFLVGRILADTSNAASVEVKADALSVVRNSLESFVGKEAVDDKVVNEITQELIRERLRTIGTLHEDDMEDVTGLKRAAAYYNEQTMLGGIESCPAIEDSSSEELVNWIDVLTEEQVSGLVQQIWKDRQATIHRAPEDIHIEDLAEIPEDRSVRWKNEATDMSEFAGPLTVSEKAVQAFDVDNQEKSTSNPEEAIEENREEIVVPVPTPPASALESICPPQTNLARALTTSQGGSGERFHELFSPVTSIGILQRLRQQRRMNKDMFDRHQMHSRMNDAMQHLSVANRVEEINDIRIVSVDRASTLTSEEECKSVSSRSMEQEDPTTAEFVPLTEKVLNLDNYTSNQSSFEIAKSISMSSSDSYSTSNHHMHGMYREIDQHQRHASTRSIRSRRLHRHKRRLSVSSSVPDSNWNAELSEGELSLEEALDLSDGELFGEDLKQYVRHKNKASSVKSKSDDDNLHSSVESGELPALMKTHANFRHQLVVQSISSVESGEHEDGSVPD